MKTSFWPGWRSWWRTAQRPRPISRRGTRLRLEQLEDRTLLSGTPQLLADINPGAASSNPSQMVVIGPEAYFVANDGTHGNALWKTDGTTAGTTLVADLNPGNLTNVNGELFFSVSSGANDYQLWKTDGTAAGTSEVKDLNASSPGSFTNDNGTLFFSGYGGLWKSDGTAAGTVLVTSNGAAGLTNVNGELFFLGSANGLPDQAALWKSNGTAAGTTKVADIGPAGAYGNHDTPGQLTNVNGELFFEVDDAPTHSYELWKSDGTADGTVLVKVIDNESDGTRPSSLTNVNGTLFFAANDDTRDTELWKSDGTAAGTTMVKDFPLGSGIPYPYHLTNVNGTLYFEANDGTHGVELWKSDGTTAGTTMVKDINPGTTTTWYYTGDYGPSTRNLTQQGSYPSNVTNVNGTLYFSANDGTHGYELWQSDGTAAGTTLVQDIHTGSSVYSYTFHWSYGVETQSATLPNNSNPSSLTNFNGTLLFAANDGTHGNELWTLGTGPSLAVSATSTKPTAGQSDSFTITALNADGTPDTTLNGTVTLTSSDPKAILPSSVILTNGVGQFSAILKTAGTQSIVATDVQTPSDNGTDTNLVVQAAAASSFTLSGFPSPATVGTPSSFTVTAYDTYGNVAADYSGTVHFSSSDPKAILPANATLSNGTGQFRATLNTVGTGLSLTAADINNAALTATASGIEVIPSVSISGSPAGALGQTLTYTLGTGADPAGTVFTVSWGDGASTQTTNTTVSHSYTSSANYSISVTASSNGLTSAPATQSVSILPITVTIEADPAKAGQQMLVLDGTANSDTIVLGAGANNGVTLNFDGTALGDILPTGSAPFALVMVFGEGGNDLLDARGLAVSTVLVGGSGNDTLYGGSGRNLLIGGAGADTLHAGSAGDILVSGYTSYDSNLTALASLMAEWDSSDSYTTRIAKLRYGGGLNGSYVLNSTTVFNDNAIDALYGGAGLDWFLAHTSGTHKDKIIGSTRGEVITSI